MPGGGDVALIVSSFGRPRNPGWYYNLRANPKAEVTYHNKTIRAIAREAGDGELQAIWDRATAMSAGYEAYASWLKRGKFTS